MIIFQWEWLHYHISQAYVLDDIEGGQEVQFFWLLSRNLNNWRFGRDEETSAGSWFHNLDILEINKRQNCGVQGFCSRTVNQCIWEKTFVALLDLLEMKLKKQVLESRNHKNNDTSGTDHRLINVVNDGEVLMEWLDDQQVLLPFCEHNLIVGAWLETKTAYVGTALRIGPYLRNIESGSNGIKWDTGERSNVYNAIVLEHLNYSILNTWWSYVQKADTKRLMRSRFKCGLIH